MLRTTGQLLLQVGRVLMRNKARRKRTRVSVSWMDARDRVVILLLGLTVVWAGRLRLTSAVRRLLLRLGRHLRGRTRTESTRQAKQDDLRRRRLSVIVFIIRKTSPNNIRNSQR